MTDSSEVARLRRQVQYEQARYLRTLDSALDAVLTVEANRVTFVNRAALTLFAAADASELHGRDPLSFFAPEMRAGLRRRYRRVFDQPGQIETSRETIIRLDGTSVPIELRVFAYQGEHGLILHSTFRDLSELEEEREYSSAIIDSLPGIFYHYDEAGRLIRWNKDHERITGHSAEELWHSTPFEHFLSEQHDELAQALDAVVSEQEGAVELDFLFADGVTTAPFLLNGRRFVSREGGAGMIGIGVDMREKYAAEQRIRHLAYHDSVTGLRNRYFFEEHVSGLLQQRTPFLLLSVGFDGFSSFTDSYGPQFGDVVLTRIGATLQAELAAWGEQALLVRYRDDEFMLLLEGLVDVAAAESVAAALQQRFATALTVETRELHVPMSIGVVGYPTHAAEQDELLRYADIAMHEAKRQGSAGVCVFRPELADLLKQHARMETELRLALRTGNGLRLVYQPIVSLCTGLIESAEALLRWDHPDFGAVAPDTFIPIAEKTELAVELGSWVLRKAVQQLALWQHAGLSEFAVAINVSALQLGRHDFAAEVMQVLQEAGVSPCRLKIELTETAIAGNRAQVRSELQQLRALGVESSIDDYGTGYSNLSYLRDFPTEYLKIDRSFISELGGDGACDLLVRNIIDVTHGLRSKVIAEGTETMAQIALLREYGCDYVQGWATGRPIEADAFAELVRENPKLVAVAG